MAVKIRLTRKGKKKQPTYRVVVADSRAPRDGRYIEQIGRYDPRQDPSVIVIDNERADYWLSQGAQPSDAVRKLLEISGAIDARPVKIKDPKVHVVDEVAQVTDAADDDAVAAAAAAESAATDDAETVLDKAQGAVGDAVEAVGDFVEETVDTLTGDGDGDSEDDSDTEDDDEESE